MNARFNLVQLLGAGHLKRIGTALGIECEASDTEVETQSEDEGATSE